MRSALISASSHFHTRKTLQLRQSSISDRILNLWVAFRNISIYLRPSPSLATHLLGKGDFFRLERPAEPASQPSGGRVGDR